MRELILGGVSSGKSVYAEQCAEKAGGEVVYVATARVLDEETRRRIEVHRQRRPSHWQVLEAPLELAHTLEAEAATDRVLLVDCLTHWLTNLHLADDPVALERERTQLLQILPRLPGRILLVGNELGLGGVPMGEGNRLFYDLNGRLHQALASICERVTLVAAGLPMYIKR